jgi:hypothetical protein
LWKGEGSWIGGQCEEKRREKQRKKRRRLQVIVG